MFVPGRVAAAAGRGDLARVQSWLNNAGPGHVHDCGDVEDYIKWQNVFAGVRAHGSYKRYLRAPHREFLRFRSLLVRGRAKTNELHERIARLPNGACWKVLSYWREDN